MKRPREKAAICTSRAEAWDKSSFAALRRSQHFGRLALGCERRYFYCWSPPARGTSSQQPCKLARPPRGRPSCCREVGEGCHNLRWTPRLPLRQPQSGGLGRGALFLSPRVFSFPACSMLGTCLWEVSKGTLLTRDAQGPP